MSAPTPTPAHQAFREKRAVEIASAPAFRGLVVGSREYGEMCAAAGMAVEHEVAYTMGAIMLLEAAMKRHNRENIDNFLTENLEVAKEHLAALLEGK